MIVRYVPKSNTDIVVNGKSVQKSGYSTGALESSLEASVGTLLDRYINDVLDNATTPTLPVDPISAPASAPAVLKGSVDISSFSGVTLGALADNTQRLANGTAIQAALNKCATDGKYAEFPPGRYEYSLSNAQSSVNTGLQITKDVPGARFGGAHPHLGTRLVQYATNQPILTIGDLSTNVNSLHTGSEFSGGAQLAYGVTQTGQTQAIGLLLGRSWNCVFGNFTVESPFAPSVAVQVGTSAQQFFFSNKVGMIRATTAQVNLFKAVANGTGSKWDSIYIGGGTWGTRVALTSSPMNLALSGAEFGSIDQLNIEWAIPGQHFPQLASSALLLDIGLLHCEGCKAYGWEVPVVLANLGAITIDQLSVSDLWCETSAAGTGGSAPSILKTDGNGSSISVRTARIFWQGSGVHAEATCATPINLMKGLTNVGETVSVEVGPTTISGHTGAFSFDTTLTATAPGTAGAVSGFTEYSYDKTRSRVRGALITMVNANMTVYAGYHTRTKVTAVTTLTATRTLTLSNFQAASGAGATIPRNVGDRIEVVRTGAGAFDLIVADHAAATLFTFSGAASANTAKTFEWTGTAWVAL